MLHTESLELLLGAVALGAVHGIEPGHGWPVAASYALDQANKWVYGFAASFILGIGHLVSSIAMVLVFFYAKSYFDLTKVDEPIHLIGNVFIGGPVSVVAGLLLIALGVREYRSGHPHGGSDGENGHHSHRSPHSDDEHSNDHTHDGAHADNHGNVHEHGHSRPNDNDGFLPKLREFLPIGGGGSRSHESLEQGANRSLLGIAWFAFLLGFAHEEEFEIIALCTGSAYCLELMFAYAITVIVGIVGLTMVLIAGFEHYEDRVEAFTPYLPAFSAAILTVMGVGFITGLF